MAEPSQRDENHILDREIRKRWKIDSTVEIYSRSSDQWISGGITAITKDEEGEWLQVNYISNGAVRSVQIQRYNVDEIRPPKKQIYDNMDIKPMNKNRSIKYKNQRHKHGAPLFMEQRRNNYMEYGPMAVNAIKKVDDIKDDEKDKSLLIPSSNNRYKLDIIEQIDHSIPNEIVISNDIIKFKLFKVKDGGDKDKDNDHKKDDVVDLYNADIIVTNDEKDEFYPPHLDNAISTMEKEDIDWISVMFDVYMNYYAEYHKEPTIDIKWKGDIKWKQYLNKSPIEKIGLKQGTQNKIVDSILGYHHYTIAISHIIKCLCCNKYRYIKLLNIKTVFIINKRSFMNQDGFEINISVMLNTAKINFIQHELNGKHLDETIKIIFDSLDKYRKRFKNRTRKIILLFQFDSDNNKYQSNRGNMYIYQQTEFDNNSTILPTYSDNHWSFFILDYYYIHRKYVKCYWKIDGKSLRFFPEHMESIWPRYFLIDEKDKNRLIFHHKYRHQFGIGLYDKYFCTLYYSITKKRFWSTHYYREYKIENKLSLKNVKPEIDDEKQLNSEYEIFKNLLNDKCNIDDINKMHECNTIKRLIFMLKKHENNELNELCVILSQTKYNINCISYIQKDIDHLMDIHLKNYNYKEICNHINTHLTKNEKVLECKTKLACWALRRRTRSIMHRAIINKDKDKDSQSKLVINNLDSKQLELSIEIRAIRRILDNLHCDIFHRDSNKNFRQMFVNKGDIGLLQNATLNDFEHVVLSLAIDSLCSDLEIETKNLREKICEKIDIIEDIKVNKGENVVNYIKKLLSDPQKYENILNNWLNDDYLKIAIVFRKYKIREEIFVNCDKKDIRDLLEYDHINIGDRFDDIYDEIYNHELRAENIDEDKNENKNKKHNGALFYKADHSDQWLSHEFPPKFKCMEDEMLLNSYSTILKSDYFDTKIECQLLHESKENNDILSCQELIALKVFTDYTHLQTAFSKAYYDDNSKDKRRKTEFYHWNLKLTQVMHYTASNSDKNTKLWRGLKGLLHFDTLTPTAQQPTSFSLNQDKAAMFCGDSGILLEASQATGITLKWLSRFEYEDEWWCFNTKYKLDKIHIKTNDYQQCTNYLRLSLQNIYQPIYDRDIGRTFNCYKGKIKEHVFDLLDFDYININHDDEEKSETQIPEILRKTRYKELSLIQRLFFELKQRFIIEPIWNMETDDIETCLSFQRIYLLENHIFKNMDKKCNSYKYKEIIIRFMKEEKCLLDDLCDKISKYINKQKQESDLDIFIDIVIKSIVIYNNNDKNARFLITQKQQDIIINYFKENKWNCDIFKKTDGRYIKTCIFKDKLGLKGKPSKQLYQEITGKIEHLFESKSNGLIAKSFEQLYDEMIKYKPFNKYNTSQLIDILKKYILPTMDENCTARTKEKILVEYINNKGLNGKSFLCNDEKEFNQNITNYVNEQKNDDDKKVDDEDDNSFIDILEISIDQHQAEHYKNKKKLYHLDKKKILTYFKSISYNSINFNKTKKIDFAKKILFKELKIKLPAGKKLWDIIDENVRNSVSITFIDLYETIKKWKLKKPDTSETVIEHKMRISNFKSNESAFDLLIGKFKLIFNDHNGWYEMKLNDEIIDNLLNLYPPQYNLIIFKKNKKIELQISSTKGTFKIEPISKVKELSKLNYKISLIYDNKHELISHIEKIT